MDKFVKNKTPTNVEAEREEAGEPEVIAKVSDILKPSLKVSDDAPRVAMKVTAAVTSHRGPLPAPETFSQYDHICPGAAREILDMAIREQRHRHFVERAESIYPFLGMLAGFVVVSGCIGGAAYLAINGHDLIAGVLIGAQLLGVVYLFINSRLQQPHPPIDQNSKPDRFRRR